MDNGLADWPLKGLSPKRVTCRPRQPAFPCKVPTVTEFRTDLMHASNLRNAGCLKVMQNTVTVAKFFDTPHISAVYLIC